MISSKNKRSLNNTLRKMSTLPVTLIALFMFSGNSEGQTLDQDEEIILYSLVEEKPLFDGKDAEMEFHRYVFQNLRYPDEVKLRGIQGRIFVEFIIDTDGSVTDVRLLRGVAPLLNAEVLRVISSSPQWTPGKHEGKVVKVRYQIPVTFKLNAEASSSNSQNPAVAEKQTSEETVYEDVETKPTFNGKDAETGFPEYVYKNTVYPVISQEKGIQGSVVVGFVIDTDGSVTDVKILRGADPLLDAEALRVISASPQWTPGKDVDGNAVKVNYLFPVNFSMYGKSSLPNAKGSEDFTKAVIQPTFYGLNMETGFRTYVGRNTVYPAEAQMERIQGRVYVEFTIDVDGSVTNVTLLRGVHPLLDAEALRVIKSSPKWTPGKDKNGNAVKVKIQFPVSFRLNN